MTISQSLISRVRAYFTETGAEHRATAADIAKAMPDVDATRISMVLADLYRRTGEFDRVKITDPRHGEGTQLKEIFTYWRIDKKRPAPLKPQKAPPRRHELQQHHAQPEVAQNTGSKASDSLATPSSAEGLAVAQEPPTPDKVPAAACSDEKPAAAQFQEAINALEQFEFVGFDFAPGGFSDDDYLFSLATDGSLQLLTPDDTEVILPARAVRLLGKFLIATQTAWAQS